MNTPIRSCIKKSIDKKMNSGIHSQLTETETFLLDILRVSLWHTSFQLDYRNVTKNTWEEIYLLSQKQGIQALILDGVAQLPPEWQPNEVLMITWAANVKIIERRNSYYIEKIEELNSIFQLRGIDMLLLKGDGLAAFYPQPLHREYGDVDIYLYENHEKGNLNEVIIDSFKHSTFIYKGIPIENHKKFVDFLGFHFFSNRKKKKALEYVENFLHEILRTEHGSCLLDNEIKVPSATFNFIYLTIHTCAHLGEGLVIRHLCDWACFLSKNKELFDEKKIEEALMPLNFKKMSLLMTNVAINYLGMPREYAPSFYDANKIENGLVEKIWHSLIYFFPNSKQVAQNTLLCKWKRFCSRQWKYNLVYEEAFGDRLYNSIIIYLKKYY